MPKGSLKQICTLLTKSRCQVGLRNWLANLHARTQRSPTLMPARRAGWAPAPDEPPSSGDAAETPLRLYLCLIDASVHVVASRRHRPPDLATRQRGWQHGFLQCRVRQALHEASGRFLTGIPAQRQTRPTRATSCREHGSRACACTGRCTGSRACPCHKGRREWRLHRPPRSPEPWHAPAGQQVSDASALLTTTCM